MTTPLVVSLLEVRLGLPVGSLTGPDKARAEAALADATANALHEVPKNLAIAWATTTAAPAEVITVILKAARREYENPQGFTQEGVLGGYTASVSNASGAELTEAEKVTVREAANATLPAENRWTGTGSIRTPSAFERPPLDAWPYG